MLPLTRGATEQKSERSTVLSQHDCSRRVVVGYFTAAAKTHTSI